MIATQTLRNKNQGQALVELALGVILLFALTLGVVELGKAFYIYNTLETAARMGARYLVSRDYQAPGWQNNAQNLVVYGNTVRRGTPALPGLTPGNVRIVTNATPPTRVTVIIDYAIRPFPGFPWAGPTYTIHPEVTMRYLQPN